MKIVKSSDALTIKNSDTSKLLLEFKGNYFENKLKLEKVVKEKNDIVQIHYRVIKKENLNENTIK